MVWKIAFTRQAAKQVQKLPPKERDLLALLVKDLELHGAVQTTWKNYSKLAKDKHHCHLSYRWVACWQVVDGKLKMIEMYYAGSRENAPY